MVFYFSDWWTKCLNQGNCFRCSKSNDCLWVSVVISPFPKGLVTLCLCLCPSALLLLSLSPVSLHCWALLQSPRDVFFILPLLHIISTHYSALSLNDTSLGCLPNISGHVKCPQYILSTLHPLHTHAIICWSGYGGVGHTMSWLLLYLTLFSMDCKLWSAHRSQFQSLPQQSSLVCLTSFWPHGWPQVFSFVAPTRVVIHIYLSGHLIKVSPFYQCINYTPRNPACFFLSETFSAPSKVPVNICK